MTGNRKPFLLWFAVLTVFFALANVAGYVRPMGLKPFRSAGFPLTIAVWGTGVQEYTNWNAAVADILIALTVSLLLALGLTWWRGRKNATETHKATEAHRRPTGTH